MDDSDAWASIFIVYPLILFKLLLADTVGAIVVTHSGFSHFIRHTGSGLASYISSIVVWVITKCVEGGCRNRENLSSCVLFLIESVSYAFALGFSCSFPDGKGKTVFAGIILTTIAVGCLILLSILGEKLDLDFRLGPLCLFLILLLICIYVPIQIYHPFAKLKIGIWGLIAATSFCSHTYVAGHKINAWLDMTFTGDSIGPIFEAANYVL